MEFTNGQLALEEYEVPSGRVTGLKTVSERIKMEVADVKQDERDFKEVFQEFGDATTFHGIRYITNSSNHIVRRLIWLMAVAGMIVWLTISLMESVTLLRQHDEITSISINYLTDVKFPAVTLCNYNQFRDGSMPKAAIETLSLVYGGASAHSADTIIDTTPLQDVFKNKTDSENIEILKDASHQIEDMIIECKWRSKPCSHLNFTQRVLDQGVCYTFNDPVDEKDILRVHNPGSKNGLFLRLNIQQNLYTFGETTAAGMKVLLHPQGELPIIKELAFSISPGFETSVAVRQKVINSLPAPFKDNCTNTKFTDYSFNYSVPACNFLCKVRYVVDKCGCRDYKWPGNEPFCNVYQQVYCIYGYEGDVGGYMGLLCGMSLLTVLEWADFIFINLLNKFWSIKKAN
ncbi:acid-sensing ion channel 2-like [Asterias rubens]|uniref:acid-sensing ion channel 2-like n=1 Tax=Asterias rubens TaxID=7604 RepID=UPI00145528AF|nr:acid-sensing ion channel 2-like [Asterias rubens]